MQNDRWDVGTKRPAVVTSFRGSEEGKGSELQNIVSRASSVARTGMSMVTILDEDTQWFVARVGLQCDRTPRAHSFCHHAVLRPGEPMIVSDARHDHRFLANPLVLSAPHIRFYAGVPLVDSSGYALGALCVADTAPRAHFSQLMELVELARLAERIICG